MATQKPKETAVKETLVKSRKKTTAPELSDEEKADLAANVEHRESKGEVIAKPARRGPIQDEVTKFLADVKSNSDAIAKTKKHELYGSINKKAFEKLVDQKDDLGGGLFRMRLGNMLRGARTKQAKVTAKPTKSKEMSMKAKAKVK